LKLKIKSFLTALFLTASVASAQVEITPFIGTLLSDDGTNVTLVSGQLLLPNGTNSAPSLARAGAPDNGIYFAGDSVRITTNSILRANFTTTTLALVYPGSAASPAFYVGNDSDSGLFFIGANNPGVTVGGALVMDWEDTNAAGGSADLVTISSTLGIMDSAEDIFRGLSINFTNVDHTDGTVIALSIGSITGDPNADEYAFDIEAGYDDTFRTASTMSFLSLGTGTYIFNDAAGGNRLVFDLNAVKNDQYVAVGDTLSIMDGDDEIIGVQVNMTNADHTGTGNVWAAFKTTDFSEDPDAFETGLLIGNGLDAHWVVNSLTAAPADFPPDQHIAFVVDDNVDYSTGGGNDCAFIAIDDTGNVTVIAILVTDGACP